MNPVPTAVTAARGTGDVAALTFDDGPNGATTTALLDFLGERGIHATFCVIGQNIQAPGGAAILRRIVSDGHLLCNHTTSYADMGSWTPEQVEADLVENLRIIRDALGDPTAQVPYFRAPNGSWGQTAAVAVSLGMQPLGVVNTIDDWATQDVPTLTDEPARRDEARRDRAGARRRRRPLRHPRGGADRGHRAPRGGLDVHAAGRWRHDPGR